MATLTIPDANYAYLAAQAAICNMTIEQFVLQRLMAPNGPTPEPTPPLTGEAWQAVRDAMIKDAEKRADRYPPGFVLDDSREAIYAERTDTLAVK